MRSITAVLLGIFLSLSVLCFSGCAASPVQGVENQPPEGQGKYDIVATPFGKVRREIKQADPATDAPAGEKAYRDEAGEFEVISTPFGYVKRKKVPAEKPTARPAAEKRKINVPPAPVTGDVTPLIPEPASTAAAPAEEGPAVAVSPSEGSPASETGPVTEPVSTISPAAAAGASDNTPVSPGVEPAAAVAVPTGGSAEEKPPEESGQISFDFDDADLDAVIRGMADFLKINYIIDPGISGKVTIHTAGQLKAADVFPVFHQTLEVNGLVAVKEGNVYRISRLKGASRMPIAPRLDTGTADIPPEERVVLQIIPLKYISAQEVSKVLTPFISAEGMIISDGGSNTLLVVDKGINILKILKLVEVFDVSVFDKTNYHFYTLQNADAGDVAKALGAIFPSRSTGGTEDVKFVPINWLNSLLAVSASADVFGRVESLVRQLDIPSEGAQPQLYVYSVKNGMAVDLGDTLRAIFSGGGSAGKGTQRKSVPTNPFAKGTRDKNAETAGSSASSTPAPASAQVEAGSQSAGSGSQSPTLRGDVRITDDDVRNALIIEALPSDYKSVKRILDRLDVLPRQALIEVIIAEISLGQGTELGIEWNFKKDDWSDTGSLSASIGSSGLQYALGLSKKWQAELHALANDSKLNIISSPTILASDNKEAKIDVTTEVPIPSTNYTYVNNGDNVMQTSVEYRDTGVILDVTPHINEYGLVTMDITQEVSNVGQLIKVAGQDYYSFDRKQILTSLTVKHNQSIVIGGLISRQKTDASSGVPWLARIPVLRWFTGTAKKEKSRSELIVMITPRVITSLEDVDAVSSEFKKKIAGVMKAFEE